jgi:hypothetical protein
LQFFKQARSGMAGSRPWSRAVKRNHSPLSPCTQLGTCPHSSACTQLRVWKCLTARASLRWLRRLGYGGTPGLHLLSGMLRKRFEHGLAQVKWPIKTTVSKFANGLAAGVICVLYRKSGDVILRFCCNIPGWCLSDKDGLGLGQF